MIEVVEFERDSVFHSIEQLLRKSWERKWKVWLTVRITQLWIFSNRENIVFEKDLFFWTSDEEIHQCDTQTTDILSFDLQKKNEERNHSLFTDIFCEYKFNHSIKSLIILINVQQMIVKKYLINQFNYLIFSCWEPKE